MANTNRRKFLKFLSSVTGSTILSNEFLSMNSENNTLINSSSSVRNITPITNIISEVSSGRSMQTLRDGWFIKQLKSDTPDITELTNAAAKPDDSWMPSTMPAQVHEILFSHGLISDPHIGKNAAESAWVGEKDWAYACTFLSPPGECPVFLRFNGLDTIATACLNGKEIGRCDNMFRHYTMQVRNFLMPSGEKNVLLIIFSSPIRFLDQAEARFGSVKGIAAAKYLRKCHSDLGSYLGARPHSMKVGIYRDVIIDVPDRAWLEDVCVRSELTKNYTHADVQVTVESAGDSANIEWILSDPTGKEINRGMTDTATGNFRISIDNPLLWLPCTHGIPHLYTLTVKLVLSDKLCDGKILKFGIRDIKPVLTDSQTGEKRFAFDVNGKRIFLRGACWAPVEGMTNCWTPDRARRLLDLIEQGRMNVLRVWGEGVIPPEEFYNECDRRGILIWQDFMFGYGIHPNGPPDFNENRRIEIEDMIRQLRNHPCILMYCGGNENQMGWSFQFGSDPAEKQILFESIMPQAVTRLDPDRLFHPSSPYGGRYPNWPLEGDWHDYTTLNFSPEASVPLYASEVGRVSAPSVSSMRKFLSDEELWPTGYDPRVVSPGKFAWPPMWQYRSVDGSWDKIGPIEEFCDPSSAEDLVRILGTAHGEYLQRRIERERRGVPDGSPDGNRRCWGNTIWRLNDAWPIIYWSAIDYYLEPKIAYYFLRRAYVPVMVCFEKTSDYIAVWVVNDSSDPVSGQLIFRCLRFDGKVRAEIQCDVELQPAVSRRLLYATDFGQINLRNEFLQASFNGQTVTYLLIGERYLHLPKPTLSARNYNDIIEVSTDVFARQVTLEIPDTTGAVFEDNFFDLSPGEKRAIRVINKAGGKEVCIHAVNSETVQVNL